MTVLLPALALMAAPLPALAIVESTKETFSGTVVGNELLLVSDEGPSCRGLLSAETLACSDGRTGTFHLERSLIGWLGYGRLDDEPLTLTIG